MAEASTVSDAQSAIRVYCRSVGLHALGRRGPPTRAQLGRAEAAVGMLASVARRKPDAPYQDQQTMRLVLGDTAEDLEGSNCSARLLDALERAIASLPPP